MEWWNWLLLIVGLGLIGVYFVVKKMNREE